MSFLFRQHSTDTLEQLLLNKKEVNELRMFAGQVDCSATLSQTLLSRDAGWLPTKPLGSGMDYAESRVYQQGDDSRYIDWRVSARSHETFVKTYHMESRPGLCIVLDKRSSMVFGTRSRLKVAQALRMTVMLAYLAEMHHMTLSVLVLEDTLHFIDNINASALLDLANSISRPTPTTRLTGKSSQPSFKSSLIEIKQQMSKGSLVYLISDFMDVTQDDQAALVQLQENYFVQAVHIMDMAEMELPRLGKIRLEGMAKSQSYKINTQMKKQRQGFVSYARQSADNKKKIITTSGCSYVRVFTDQDDIYSLLTMPLGKSL